MLLKKLLVDPTSRIFVNVPHFVGSSAQEWRRRHSLGNADCHRPVK